MMAWMIRKSLNGYKYYWKWLNILEMNNYMDHLYLKMIENLMDHVITEFAKLKFRLLIKKPL